MKLSSHLFFRSDGSLGRFPIISFSPEGEILQIEECGATLRETAHQQFVGGILVAALAHPLQTTSELQAARSKEDFVSVIARAQKLGELSAGQKCPIDLIENVDLNTFAADKAIIRRVVWAK